MPEADLLTDINGLIHKRLGIYLDSKKDYLLKARIEKLLDKEAFTDLKDFHRSLSAGDEAAFEALVKHITTNHTFFYRESAQFDQLGDLVQKANLQSPVIWSAACSTGEEPYSLIISLKERGLQDFLVVASDVNAEVLLDTAQGVYHENRLNYLPAGIRAKYFTAIGPDRHKIDPRLSRHLRLKRLNLVEPLHFEKQFDAIFCRNLLIYFDKKTIDLVVNHLVANLKVGGWLFIGASENLISTPEKLKKLASSVYQKVKE